MSEFRRKLLMQVENNEEVLPAGCVRCEYLESTGLQYIDSEYIPNLKTRTRVEAQFTNNMTGVWGGFTSGTAYDIAGYDYSKGRWFMRAFCPGASNKTNWTFDTEWHIFETDAANTTVAIDGDVEARTRQGAYIGYRVKIFLFARNLQGTGIELYSHSRLKSVCIWEDDVLMCDFLPILDPNGTPCLYDTVVKKFHYNKGTGQFLYKILVQ
jgi:hypothetical protein